MKRTKKEMTKKLSSMVNMPEECLACSVPFDKTSKEHAKTWFVVHRKNQAEPNLYCPECWDRNSERVEELNKRREK